MISYLRSFLFWVVLSSLSFCAFGAGPKLLLVHYRPWFVGKPYSEHWGWHWTMDHFDPDHVDASGQPQIASWYRPLIGPYDSADPTVLEYHVLLMKLAGIDGVIVDWHGSDNYLDYAINNERTLALLKSVNAARLKFALCYEDSTIQQQVAQGFLAASNAVAQAQRIMSYAQSNFFSNPAYLRLSNRPVLLNFGPQFFKDNDQWTRIFSVLEPTNQPALFTEDNPLPTAAGAFNWPPMWLSLAPGTRGVLSMAVLQEYLSAFEEKGNAWPSFISSAFPRFHDIYQSAGVRSYWGYLGDRKGQTFCQTLCRALTNNSVIVQVVTWNDFGEGTMVEPTVEYGFRDLGIIQEHRRKFLEPGFPCGTNDLVLPLRIFRLRQSAVTNTTLRTQLDLASTEIINNKPSAARTRLQALEYDNKTMDHGP
jgi:hypothetical protein